MINMTAVGIVLAIALVIGVVLGITIIIDTLLIIRERVLMFLEKYFPKYYYYDYEDKRRR